MFLYLPTYYGVQKDLWVEKKGQEKMYYFWKLKSMRVMILEIAVQQSGM